MNSDPLYNSQSTASLHDPIKSNPPIIPDKHAWKYPYLLDCSSKLYKRRLFSKQWCLHVTTSNLLILGPDQTNQSSQKFFLSFFAIFLIGLILVALYGTEIAINYFFQNVIGAGAYYLLIACIDILIFFYIIRSLYFTYYADKLWHPSLKIFHKEGQNRTEWVISKKNGQTPIHDMHFSTINIKIIELDKYQSSKHRYKISGKIYALLIILDNLEVLVHQSPDLNYISTLYNNFNEFLNFKDIINPWPMSFLKSTDNSINYKS